MEALDNLLQKFRRRPKDVVGVDMGATAVKAVRLRGSANGTASVVAAGIMPLPSAENETDAQQEGKTPAPLSLNLPSKLRARYACLAISGEHAIVKLLSFPGRFDAGNESRLVESLGVQDPDAYRIGYKLVREGHARTEARVLGVAIPDEEAVRFLAPFETGLPAPFSMEISGLAGLTAFAHGPLSKMDEEAAGLVDFGTTTTVVAFFHRQTLALVRQFGIGTGALVSRVQQSLGVDAETAQGIISDGAFDISQTMLEVLSPLIKQVGVSRDFVERREDCRVQRVFISGSAAKSRDVIGELRTALELDIENWDPFDGLNVADDAIPEQLKGQEWRFASAIGACLGTFEEV